MNYILLSVILLGSIAVQGCGQGSKSKKSNTNAQQTGTLVLETQGAVALGLADQSFQGSGNNVLKLNEDGQVSSALKLNLGLELGLVESNIKIDAMERTADGTTYLASVSAMVIEEEQPQSLRLAEGDTKQTFYCYLAQADKDTGKVGCVDYGLVNIATNETSVYVQTEGDTLYYSGAIAENGQSVSAIRKKVGDEISDVLVGPEADGNEFLIKDGKIFLGSQDLRMVKEDGAIETLLQQRQEGPLHILPNGELVAFQGGAEQKMVMYNTVSGAKTEVAIADAKIKSPQAYFDLENGEVFGLAGLAYQDQNLVKIYPAQEVIALTDMKNPRKVVSVGQNELVIVGESAQGAWSIVKYNAQSKQEAVLVQDQTLQIQTMDYVKSLGQVVFSGLKGGKQVTGTIDLSSGEVKSQEAEVKLNQILGL